MLHTTSSTTTYKAAATLHHQFSCNGSPECITSFLTPIFFSFLSSAPRNNSSLNHPRRRLLPGGGEGSQAAHRVTGADGVHPREKVNLTDKADGKAFLTAMSVRDGPRVALPSVNTPIHVLHLPSLQEPLSYATLLPLKDEKIHKKYIHQKNTEFKPRVFPQSQASPLMLEELARVPERHARSL